MTDNDIRNEVRHQYPEAYFVANVGWCGPSWQEAVALESLLRDRQRVYDADDREAEARAEYVGTFGDQW